ncbi:Chitin deacetylase [Psilocybe cubensis]|uniref:Chitin deacetylase n=2 Tax=Psilocybe cubensis TaxID=181762 RepID=A0ACB8H413_PSICU|nr:Chitin deacetylase [Psilocybe cubensis]KAH9482648.1 Chitin deacetylase [Psilocybe cubensis]
MFNLNAFYLLPFIIYYVAAVPTRSADGEMNNIHLPFNSLSNDWFHDDDHPVHALFKRAPGEDIEFPSIGTPAWASGYPPGPPDPALLPVEWVRALEEAIAAGKIPDIPQTTNYQGSSPVYPYGINPSSPEICSSTYKCRIPGDFWDSPNGVFGSSFDDGPTPSTPLLVDFLSSVNQTTTHFMIGIKMLYQPTQLQAMIDAGHDLAIHTWTHPYMTTLDNYQILGQLGWTMQLIYNSTGGRLAKFWRPPYGDSDRRVTAIAREVFGLRTVIWNYDTDDWIATPQEIGSSMSQFLAAPKSPGLMVLSHELTDMMVYAFIKSFPEIGANGWRFSSLAKALEDGRPYQDSSSSGAHNLHPDGIVLDVEPYTSTELTPSPSATDLVTSSAITPSPSAISANTADVTKSSTALRTFPLYLPVYIYLWTFCAIGALGFSL